MNDEKISDVDSRRVAAQRRNAQKGWVGKSPEERSAEMRRRNPQAGWARFPTPEARKAEIARRRALWWSPPPPKPAKPKLEGKALHVCKEHDRDYSETGLFGKYRGVFPQRQHWRGRTRHEASPPEPFALQMRKLRRAIRACELPRAFQQFILRAAARYGELDQ